jgi:2-hydroxychromene-2-carboxylate isomerase
MKRPPRLFFSFRSPFSWLLIERMGRVAPGAIEQIELVPYWEPDEATAAALARRGAAIHYAQMSKAKHLYILQDVKRLATDLGLAVAWPVDVDAWWEPSHLGWLAARRAGRERAFYDALVAARWQRGEDISRLETVAAAAEQAGCDGDAIVAAVDDPEIRAAGVQCLEQADQDDIFGVPYLIAGWRRFWGYDRLDAFLAAAGLADPGAGAGAPLAGIPDAILAGAGMYDNDTAGGCG